MAFRVVSTPTQAAPTQQPQQPQIGLAASILRSLVSPIRRSLGQGVELGFDIGDKLGMGNAEQLGVKNPFLSQQEAQQLNTGAGNYAKQTAQNIAGIGANFVPFGQGANLFTRAVVPGATAGALQAFGDNQNAIGGAITGGLTGGILGKLFGTTAGKAAQAAREAEPVLPKVAGTALESTPGFSANQSTLRKLAGEIGITDVMPSTQKAGLLDTTFNSYQDTINQMLKGSEPVPQTTILSNLAKNYTNSNIDEASGPTKRLIDFVLGKLQAASGDNVRLNALKSEARKQMGNAFEGGSSTYKKDVWGMVYDTIKDSLDTVSPQIREINQKQRGLFDLAEEFVPQAKKAGETVNLTVPFTNASVPTPITKEGATGFTGGIGRAIAAPFTGTANAVQSLRQKLPASDTSLGASLMNIGARLPASMTAPSQQQIQESRQQAVQGLISQGITNPSEITSILNEGATRQGMTGDFTPQEVAQLAGPSSISNLVTQPPKREVAGQDNTLKTLLQLGVASGDITPTAANFILEQRGMGKSSTAQQKIANQTTALEQNINQLESQLSGIPSGAAGIPSSLLSRIPALGLAPEAEVFNALKKSFVGPVARVIAQEVGVLTDQDVKRNEDILPKITDTAQIRSMKIQAIRTAIQNLKGGQAYSPTGQSYIQSLGGGSDNSGLESLQGLLQ